MAEQQTNEKQAINWMKFLLFSLLIMVMCALGFLSLTESLDSGAGNTDRLVSQSREVVLAVRDTMMSKAGAAEQLIEAADEMDKLANRTATVDGLNNLLFMSDGSRKKLKKVLASWQSARAEIDKLVQGRQSLAFIGESATDVTTTMSAIQEENAEVVKGLLLASAPAAQVTWSQWLDYSAERISHSYVRFLMPAESRKLGQNLYKELSDFNAVLSGLLNGDRSRGLQEGVTNLQILPRLQKMTELFAPVSRQLEQIREHAEKATQAKSAAMEALMLLEQIDEALDSLAQEPMTALAGFVQPILLGLALVLFFAIYAMRGNKTVV
ncbi:MAG: hypothetical protein OEZ23_09520, partial [Gammaproteobacteria bacterium]|nr:hypothetical protein [Gammaproteobacteria bacterium]